MLNESATCVSRSLFGCTTLPGRNTNTDAEKLQFHYLLAVSYKGLRGCDTEAWQLGRGAGSVWRPGKPAFLGASSSRVIAWTKLVK